MNNLNSVNLFQLFYFYWVLIFLLFLVNVLGIGYAYGAIATKKRKFAAGANNMRQHEFLSFAQLVKDIITNSRNRNIHIYASHPSNIGITAVAWKDFLDLILKTDEGAYRIIANHTVKILRVL